MDHGAWIHFSGKKKTNELIVIFQEVCSFEISPEMLKIIVLNQFCINKSYKSKSSMLHSRM